MAAETTFQRKLRERREQLAREEANVKAQEKAVTNGGITFDADLIPEEVFERSDEDNQMDAAINSVDILQAYNLWCGKSVIKKGPSQTESIMISCPIPGHRDSNPSAWVNTDTQLWFCGGCNKGGDKYDIAASFFGIENYKSGKNFHDLRRKMAEALGFTITVLPGNVTVMTPPIIEPEKPAKKGKITAATDDEAPAPRVTTEEPITDDPDDDGNVYEMYLEEDEIIMPSLNWRPIVPDQTFLGEYMKACVIDDVPEEYHFWNGLLALGMALGRDVRLSDSVPVHGNLFVCTLGMSGSGKSKAKSHLDKLLHAALPHKWEDPNSKGTRIVRAPGSGEVLVYQFMKPIEDPTNPKKVAYYAPVRGMIDFNELSALVGRSGRQGSTLGATLMEFYDMPTVVATSAMTSGEKRAELPFASCSTTTQPKALKGLLTNQDAVSGFLNRWVFATGKEKKRYAIGGVMVDTTPAVAPLQAILGWGSSFGAHDYIQWTSEAHDRFTKWFHDVHEPRRRSGDEMTVRMDLLMKKLILLFTANLQEKVVPLAAVESALAMDEYIVQSYGIPSGQIGNSLTSEISEAVQALIVKQFKKDGTGITLRQIYKSLWRRKYPDELITKCCKTLVELGIIEVQTSKAGDIGRPTVRYRHVG